MRSKNPEYKKEIIAYVDQFYSQTHEFPTCSQIAASTSLPRTAVFNYLVAMHKDGTIEYDGKRILTPSQRQYAYMDHSTLYPHHINMAHRRTRQEPAGTHYRERH